METTKNHSVAIIRTKDDFIVRVIENDETTDRSYGLEESARAYAEGQRIRMKLKSYAFVLSDEDA